MLPEDYLKTETEYKTYLEWLEYKKEFEESKDTKPTDTFWPLDDSEFFKIYPESMA